MYSTDLTDAQWSNIKGLRQKHFAVQLNGISRIYDITLLDGLNCSTKQFCLYVLRSVAIMNLMNKVLKATTGKVDSSFIENLQKGSLLLKNNNGSFFIRKLQHLCFYIKRMLNI